MHNRRNFIKQTSAAAIAGMFATNNANAFFSQSAQHAIGLQLFTFFDTIDKDVQGTLKQVATIGYKEIESAFSKKGGYYGMQPKAFASYLSSIGLSWVSHHVLGAPFKLPPGAKMPTGADGKRITIPPIRNLRDNMQELVDEVAGAGVQWLVCANTPINTLNDINASLEVLNKTGEACKKAGIGFAYHNHDAEFGEVEGKVPYQMMLEQLDAGNVKFELDIAWSIKGRANPVELFKQHPGRFPLWHLKDLDASRETILPLGGGTIDYKPIFAAATIAGMQHFFVEHDMPQDAYASIKESYAYLTNVVKV